MDKKYIVRHDPSNELVIPLSALTNNIDFLLSKSKKSVIFSDGTEKEVKEYREINILSEEGKDIIKRIYNISWYKFIEVWYKKNSFESLSFLWIKF